MKVAISSGHGKFVRGASSFMDEVDEARRVTNKVAEYLRQARATVNVFHDDVSRDKSSNLRRIVAHHNGLGNKRQLDISVHFNAFEKRTGPVGCEVLYTTQHKAAADLSRAISMAGGLINRGAKKRTNLHFLNATTKPSVLLEVAFVDSRTDTDLYKKNFDPICRAIASTIVGETELPVPPPVGPDLEGQPILRKGDRGDWVVYLQQELNNDNQAGLTEDGIFGSGTDTAVRNYQSSRRLTVDGIVGRQTWDALEADLPPVTLPGMPAPLSDSAIAEISGMAAASKIASFNWTGRGKAPIGYVKGVALAYATTYRQLKMGYPPAVEMARPNTMRDDDALQWYSKIFIDNNMDNSEDGERTLRHLWTLLFGLGMRESSGRYCEGRDTTASNVSAVTAEAGAWQTSFNARVFSPRFVQLFDAYRIGGGRDPQGFVEVFREGVNCKSADWQNFGTGDGLRHQQLSKNEPAYAAQVCAITLRVKHQHYGPIKRREAQVVKAAEELLWQVQEYCDKLQADGEVGV